MKEKEEETEFKVKDRRRFSSETGEIKDPNPEEPLPPKPETPHRASEPSVDETGTRDVEVTFPGFILGLSSQALFFLGQIPDPKGGQGQQDLSAARQIIDILSMLSDKTRGNLGKDEQTLLERILFDLRTKYIELSKA